jgi:hypothetical protein
MARLKGRAPYWKSVPGTSRSPLALTMTLMRNAQPAARFPRDLDDEPT